MRDARARRRRACAARPPCTSATATASRPTSTGRRRSAASGGSTSRPSRCSPRSAHRPGVARVRELARADRADRRCSTGKDVLVGAIDVATDRVETPEEVAATIRARAALRAGRAALPVHQLRDGAAAPGGRPRQARGAGGRARRWCAGNCAGSPAGYAHGRNAARRREPVHSQIARPFAYTPQRCFVSSAEARPPGATAYASRSPYVPRP